MDDIDRKILKLLQENARMSLKTIAEKTFLSSPAVSARIEKDNNNNYILQVYGNTPMRRYSLQLDEKEGYFTCDVLGTGYITYDEQAKSTTINFSDLWIFTN